MNTAINIAMHGIMMIKHGQLSAAIVITIASN